VVQSVSGPIGVLGQGAAWQLVVIMMVAQHTIPVPQLDDVRHIAASVAAPLLLPLPPPLLLAVPVSSGPASVGAAGAGLLLELQATANATAAALETDHKIIEFFILETSLLSLGEPQAACVSPSYAVSYPSPVSGRCRKSAPWWALRAPTLENAVRRPPLVLATGPPGRLSQDGFSFPSTLAPT
jgi:hypothetical protein